MRTGLWTPLLAVGLALAGPFPGFPAAGEAQAGQYRGGGGGHYRGPPRGYYAPAYRAPPYRYYAPYPYRYGYYPPPYYGGHYRNGNAVAIGLGVFASVAALAALSNSNARDADPPPVVVQQTVPPPAYPPSGYDSGGARSPVDLCTDAAVVEASRQSGSARLGRVLAVDGAGGDLSVSGVVSVGAQSGPASRGNAGGREYDADGFPVGSGSGGGAEVGFRCRTAQGRVASLQFDSAMEAYRRR